MVSGRYCADADEHLFASKSGRGQAQGLPIQPDYEAGFAAALASVALAVGVNPESFLSPEDVQALRKVQR